MSMEVKSSLLSLILFLNTTLLMAQNGISNIIPPTPEASNFLKYDFYPANHTSGAITVDIPIYTIKCNGMELPISLSYHTSGIKVNDISSEVGLGWVLNASGFISVTHNGLSSFRNASVPAKESWPNMLQISNLQNPNYTPSTGPICQYFNNLESYGDDTEASVYNYHAPGISGGYIYKQALNGSKSVITVPKSTDKVIDISSGTIIANEKGTLYEFTKTESVGGAVNNWHLTKMSSPISDDKITFEYGITAQETDYAFEGSSITIATGTSYCPFGLGKSDFIRLTTREIPLLTKINFPSGYILFLYDNNRIDKRRYSLKNIEIYNNLNTLIQRVELNQTYFKTSPGAQPRADYKKNVDFRLKLDNIRFKDANGELVNKYEFSYDMQHNLPKYFDYDDFYGNNYNNSYFGQDLWGYYNGISNNTSFLSNESYFNTIIADDSQTADFSNYSSYLANRDINTDYVKTAILTSVKYPTGGITNFEYESNADENGNKLGGLRVSKIIKNAGSGGEVKEFKYLTVHINESRLPKGGSFYDCNRNCTYAVPHQGNPGEYRGTMATMTSFSDPTDLTISGNSAYYSKVEEYEGTSIHNNGKTLYEYEYVRDSTSGINRMYTTYYPKKLYNLVDLSWKRGQLKKITHYKSENCDVNCIYTPVKSIENFYSVFLEETIMVGIDFHRTTISGSSLFCSDGFSYGDKLIRIGFKKLTSTIETDYVSSDVRIVKTINHQYGNLNHMQITQSDFTSSDGFKRVTHYKYPDDVIALNSLNGGDLTNLEKSAVDKLKFTQQHRISELIQKEIFKDLNGNGVIDVGELESRERTNYKEWYENLILPEYVQNSSKQSALESKIQFNSYYADGNIKEVSQINGTHVVYFWGYDKKYPIAKIENATFSQIATALSLTESALQNFNENNLNIINSLRANQQLSGCQVSTYTYTPLVGITSVTDPKGSTIYYKYDNYNRLESVKDSEGNILSENEYHYKQ